MEFSQNSITLWGREVVSRQAHNLKIGGSNPSPATNRRTGGFYSKQKFKQNESKLPNKNQRISSKILKEELIVFTVN